MGFMSELIERRWPDDVIQTQKGGYQSVKELSVALVFYAFAENLKARRSIE